MATVINKSVGPIGYGLMGKSNTFNAYNLRNNNFTDTSSLIGFTWRPEPPPLDQAITALKTALNNGMTLWNGAEFYGPPEYNSMTLLKAYFTKYPEDADKVTLIIKGGVDLKTLKPDGSPENVRRSLDNIISQLGGTKKLDLFSCSRRDPSTPLEVTFGVIQKEYIDTGKLGAIALSECSADTINEAAKIAKIGTVEVELSIFTPDILRNGVAAACAQHGIPITAYSPIGRGVSPRPPQRMHSLANTQMIDPHRSIQRSLRPPAIRLHRHLPALPKGRLRAQPQARQPGRDPRQGKGLHPSPTRRRLGSQPEQPPGPAYHHPHPRRNNRSTSGGELEGGQVDGGGHEEDQRHHRVI